MSSMSPASDTLVSSSSDLPIAARGRLFRESTTRAGLLAALATRSLLLRRIAAAAAAAACLAPAASRTLSAPARRAGRVGYCRRPRLAHPLLAQALVLFVILDAGAVIFCHCGVLLPCVGAHWCRSSATRFAALDTSAAGLSAP